MTSSETEYQATYWCEGGRYQSEYERLRQELVPQFGEAETVRGELLRCVSRIYYDHFNNGSGNHQCGWGGFREMAAFVWAFRHKLSKVAGKMGVGGFDEKLRSFCKGRFTDKVADEVVDTVLVFLVGDLKGLPKKELVNG
jgi:hypothetical protein